MQALRILLSNKRFAENLARISKSTSRPKVEDMKPRPLIHFVNLLSKLTKVTIVLNFQQNLAFCFAKIRNILFILFLILTVEVYVKYISCV